MDIKNSRKERNIHLLNKGSHAYLQNLNDWKLSNLKSEAFLTYNKYYVQITQSMMEQTPKALLLLMTDYSVLGELWPV